MLRAIYLVLLVGLFVMGGAAPARAGTSLSFPVTFSEAVNVTGTPRLVLDVGGVTRYATYAAGTASATLTFTYTTQAGDLDLDGVTVSSSLDLNGGAIADLNGNALSPLTFSLPDTSAVKVAHPSLSLDFVGSDYILNGTHYGSLSSFLTAASGLFNRGSTGTYFDSSGTLQSAPVNTPRFDFDPVTHVAKGLLIEESRTNYIENSLAGGSVVGGSFPSGWTWDHSGFAPTASVVGKGTINGMAYTDFRYQGTLPASGHWFTLIFGYSPIISATNTTDITSSIYLALVAGSLPNGFSFIVSQRNGGTYLSNQTLMSIPAASITSILTRFSGTAKPSQPTTTNVIGPRLICASNGSTTVFDFTLRVAAPQVEIGAFPTSYISTTTAAVTRSADALSMPVGSWFSATNGTLMAEFEIPYVGGTSYPGAVSIDNTGNHAFHLFVSDNWNDMKYAEIWTGAVKQLNDIGPVYTAGAVTKLALYYSSTQARGSFDGVLGNLTTVSLPAVSLLRVGSGRGGNYILNGWVRQVKFYPLTVSDAQLQLLTQ